MFVVADVVAIGLMTGLPDPSKLKAWVALVPSVGIQPPLGKLLSLVSKSEQTIEAVGVGSVITADALTPFTVLVIV